MATEEGAKAVEFGLVRASIAGEALSQLAESISSSAQLATVIDASSGQQVVGLDQIVQAVRDIEQGSRGTMGGMAKIETASSQLALLGKNLKELIEHYKL